MSKSPPLSSGTNRDSLMLVSDPYTSHCKPEPFLSLLRTSPHSTDELSNSTLPRIANCVGLAVLLLPLLLAAAMKMSSAASLIVMSVSLTL